VTYEMMCVCVCFNHVFGVITLKLDFIQLRIMLLLSFAQSLLSSSDKLLGQ